jgi:hypothetical protein
LQFFVDLLGFSLVADYRLPSGGRWVAVAPPDGTAILALVAPKPDEAEYKNVGQAKQIVFLTEDVGTKYHEWQERGVVFLPPPREPSGPASADIASNSDKPTSQHSLDENHYILFCGNASRRSRFNRAS